MAQEAEFDGFVFLMEEDPEMYAAGLPVPTATPVATAKPLGHAHGHAHGHSHAHGHVHAHGPAHSHAYGESHRPWGNCEECDGFCLRDESRKCQY